jgi:hypothetical protein
METKSSSMKKETGNNFISKFESTFKLIKKVIIECTLLLTAVILIIFVILIQGEVIWNQYDTNPLINVVLTILNLIGSVIITWKIGKWGWASESYKNQKKVAKTAIRHISNYNSQLSQLMAIVVDAKIDTKDLLGKQRLKEIFNHLSIIKSGILATENDFRELVNEEIVEQNIREEEIKQLISKYSEKSDELKKARTKNEENHEIIKNLTDEKNKLRRELSRKVLPSSIGNNNYELGSEFKLDNIIKTNYILGDLS